MIKWHSGPPPAIGWWPASLYKDKRAIRWWNGEVWSIDVLHTCDAQSAGNYAKNISAYQSEIKWREPWWVNKQGEV